MQENWIDTLVTRVNPDLIYSETKENPPAKLTSKAWSCSSAGFYRARSCIFEATGKFRAETLVIYPCVGHFLPVFGCEYIELPSRSLAVIDFHPIGGNLEPINEFLYAEADRTVEKSTVYDLSEFFSHKMWHVRGGKEVYGPFKEASERYIEQYYKMLRKNPLNEVDHASYNAYMGQNDPAHGILKAYFGKEFADDYIREFLFR